ncbi:MAG: N-acetylmuramoyl-L-alanine amidase [Acidimicrobiia bacterium]|nr:N-acetylmuramoyl-L-alanine amidase [Acidimicrobiia bacterium]
MFGTVNHSLVLVVATAVVVAVSACTDLDGFDERSNVGPDQLAFDDGSGSAGSTTTTAGPEPSNTTTVPPPIPLGSPDEPFVDLPDAAAARAVITPTGVVLPVLGEQADSFTVLTACENIRYVNRSAVEPIGRAHVVLDPGHGGTEVGAVGPAGTVEKEVNLAVATEAAARLEQLGATVVLTRSTDHNVTTGTRGLLAKSIDPALFVSVHHNGGAPRSNDGPGTIVFTKDDSGESTRFGGLFHDRLGAALESVTERERKAHAAYITALDAHQAAVAEYDRSVQARDAALVANGQLPADATTIPAPPPQAADGFRYPSERNPSPTTTSPPPPPPTDPDGSPGTNPDGSPLPTPTTVAVPDTLPVPPPFDSIPVREFLFAGGPNGGVRSWVRADGKDYLSVLRHSGDVPGVLTEFLYVTNPSEEQLLMDPAFVSAEAEALAGAIVDYFSSTTNTGGGFVDDQFDDQPIGGGGLPSQCVEPDLGV